MDVRGYSNSTFAILPVAGTHWPNSSSQSFKGRKKINFTLETCVPLSEFWQVQQAKKCNYHSQICEIKLFFYSLIHGLDFFQQVPSGNFLIARNSSIKAYKIWSLRWNPNRPKCRKMPLIFSFVKFCFFVNAIRFRQRYSLLKAKYESTSFCFWKTFR